MGENKKIEERKSYNVPFLTAFKYLMEKQHLTQGKLAKLLQTNSSHISAYRSGTKRVSTEMMDALIRLSKGKISIYYLKGLSQYMLLENVPNDEMARLMQKEKNPDFDLIENAKNKNDSKQQAENLLEILSNRIRLVDDLREKMKEELAEFRNIRAELQQARNELREATTRLNLMLRNEKTPLMAAEEMPLRRCENDK